MATLKDNHLKFKLELQAALQKSASGHVSDPSAAALAPDRPVPARRVLLCADSGYTHLVAVIPRRARVDLERISKLLGGARVEKAGPCACNIAAGDFRLDTIVDTSLEGHDFELPLDDQGGQVLVKYADFVHSCHPVVAPIIQL